MRITLSLLYDAAIGCIAAFANSRSHRKGLHPPSIDTAIMDQHRAQTASDLLYRHWMQGTLIAELPPEIRPSSRAEGYAIQARLEGRTSNALYGWKIAATS